MGWGGCRWDGEGVGGMGRVIVGGRVQGGEWFEVWWDAAVMGHVIVKVAAIDRNDSIGLSKYCIYMYPCIGWCGDVRVRPNCSVLGRHAMYMYVCKSHVKAAS